MGRSKPICIGKDLEMFISTILIIPSIAYAYHEHDQTTKIRNIIFKKVLFVARNC